VGSVEGIVIRTRYESGNLRPLAPLDLAEGSELRIDIVRVIRERNDPTRELLEGDEVEVKVVAVLRHGRGDKEAMMKTATEYPRVVKDSAVRNGQPSIDGTDVSVSDIVRLKREGYSELEIFNKYAVFPHAGPVYAALAYYHDGHQAEVDAYIAADELAEAQATSERKRDIVITKRKDKRERLKSGLTR
jgi:uncharacterized protein (DUF433 family)/predicted DNA-binding antitoxin AbrB/MazE fold protein